jgi:hypothetical protein
LTDVSVTDRGECDFGECALEMSATFIPAITSSTETVTATG